MTVLRHLPNVITVLRLLLVPPVAWALLAGHYTLALVMFACAGLSDGVDGALARRCGWTSRFGAIADPLADKVLMGTCFVVLALIAAVPVWLTALVLVRDLLIVAGGSAYHLLYGPFSMAPTRLGKLNTVAQVVCVLVLLVQLAAPGWLGQVAGQLAGPMVWLVAALVVASGLDYVLTWSRRAVAGGAAADGGTP